MSLGSKEKDSELILMVRQGRREAFAPIVERYWGRVKSMIRRIIKNQELVEDLCQETFIRAYEKIDQFDLTREFSPWIMKIAYNLVGEHFRKTGQKFQLVPIDEADLVSNQPGPSDQVLGRMLMDECLERLPLFYRIMFALRHGMMFSYEEISQILEEPIGTIKVNIFRARELLRVYLNHKSQENVMEGTKPK